MNPEALLRSILQAAETKHATVLKAEQDFSAALRQLLDKQMSRAYDSAVAVGAGVSDAAGAGGGL